MGFVMGFDTGFSLLMLFAGEAAFAFVVVGFRAALVDFALLGVFFVSGTSISTGSRTTFFGLPLFFTATSADIGKQK